MTDPAIETDPGGLSAGSHGKAHEAVAQSAAIAVQDAVDALRNATTTAHMAAGIALAQYLEGERDPGLLEFLTATSELVKDAIENFAAVTAAATAALNEFPSG